MMASIQKYHNGGAAQGATSMESVEPTSLLEANLRAEVTNEDHLQSLGFVMENGKPRFKIDEPVGSALSLGASSLGLSTMQCAPNSVRSEEESFVVLGKDSLSSIQASSLASYAQIQQKSSSMDYNSIVSSLTAEETEKKLRELLQENVKLKETLKQNNLAMKQQFNTLAAWQEEIMKVHQSHKQKFSETKELINQLRRENSDLKIKVLQESSTISDHDSKVKELESRLQKSTLVQSAREVELEEANSKLIKELFDSKAACTTLRADVDRQTALSSRLNQQLKQAELTIEGLKLEMEKLELNLKEKEQLASFVDFSLLTTSVKQRDEFETSKEKSKAQEAEIKHLRELVDSLQYQITAVSQNSLPTIEITPGDRPPTEDRSQFIRNVKQYNDILTNLSETYAKQGTRHISIQESLRELIEILQDLETTESDDVARQEKQSKVASCRARLNDERLEMIKEKQELIKAQNQFQKIFSDYNSVLYELEIMYEENAKLSCMQDKIMKINMEQRNTEGSAVDEEENLSKEKKSLEEMRASILQEKTNISEDKRARDALQKECDELRANMKQQNLIREAIEKAFLIEKKEFEKKILDLQTKNGKFERSLKSESENVDRLKAEIKTLKEETELIPVLQAQLQSHKSDFDEEREARTKLIEKNDKLVSDYKELQKVHTNLLATMKGPKIAGVGQKQQQQQQQNQQQQSSASGADSGDAPPPVITAFSCPKCSLSFKALRPLQEHVEECLELQ